MFLKLNKMKKIIISSLLMIAVSAFAQQNQTNNGWGDSDTSNNNYSNNNYNNSSNADYPDDYYYDYPTDYYPQSYYESYYNDYRNSIVSINWPQIFVQYRLSRYQINQILYLNNRYQNFSSWDSYYGVNPDRWYYERFNALQFILGPHIFISFQNNYYHGHNPVVYFQNYRRTYYVPRYNVRTQYRNINIVNYRVDRNNYRNPRANNGLYNPNPRSNGNATENTGFRSGVRSSDSNHSVDNGFRSDSDRAQNTQPGRNISPTQSTRQDGFRSGVRTEEIQPDRGTSANENPRNNGFRSGNSSGNGSPRVGNSGPRSNQNGMQNSRSTRQEARATRQAGKVQKTGNERGGGFR